MNSKISEVNISDIKIGDRFRKDICDLLGLQLNPRNTFPRQAQYWKQEDEDEEVVTNEEEEY